MALDILGRTADRSGQTAERSGRATLLSRYKEFFPERCRHRSLSSRTAFSLRISGFTSGLMGSFSKSPIQRSTVSAG